MRQLIQTAIEPVVLACLLTSSLSAKPTMPPWARAHQKLPPPTIDETKAFMRRLADYVFEHHLKRQADSPQRGMTYEYYDTTRAGQHDQFVQGEALDTMHDGAWLAAALVNAHRATGDAFYREFLTSWSLPFYLKMLNHSDTLFGAKHNHARPDRQATWRENKEWLLQEGEKGFVPYWWDDGGSVSLERRVDGRGPAFPCYDHYIATGESNPQQRLYGYSLGSSNHMAQDLGVMLELAWLWLNQSTDEADRRLLAEVREAAKNLQQCRMNHHGYIPACVAPAALAAHDVELWKRLPDGSQLPKTFPDNHYVRCLAPAKTGQRMSTPGFADDQEYVYYAGIARHSGRLPRALAFRLVYDAFTLPQLYAIYCDDEPPPPGMNRFDLHPYYFRDGKPEDYRSQRKGPSGQPRPIGSRYGPQNMVVCGWALQALAAYPGLWEERHTREFAQDTRIVIDGPATRQVRLGQLSLTLRSTRDSLELEGTIKGELPTIELFAHPDAQGSHAVIKLATDGKSALTNDQGAALIGDATISETGGKRQFRVRLPYTFVINQQPWANGYEHGRLSIRVGGDVRNLYLASSEENVKRWLERELGGGLRTWEAVFAERGYIPTGFGIGSFGGGYRRDNLSDCGGYAHLISAAAQWIFYQQGKRDWELLGVPDLNPKKP